MQARDVMTAPVGERHRRAKAGHLAGTVRWMGALLVALASAAAPAQGAPWVVKRVHGVHFALVVESVFESAAPGIDPRHARVLEHRLRVVIQDEKTGRAVRIGAVTADVAESGYAGTTVALTPADPRERGLYEGRVRMRTALQHRILIHATPAGGGRALEAQFEYRHHQ